MVHFLEAAITVEAGIALVIPEDTHQFSDKKHTITAGDDINISAGHSYDERGNLIKKITGWYRSSIP